MILFGGVFDIESKNIRIEELEEKSQDPEIWADNSLASKILKELNGLKESVSSMDELESEITDYSELLDMVDVNDTEELAEIESGVITYGKKIEEFDILTTFTGATDTNDAIITIKPGAGGTESQDWASILMRMYIRYAERKGYDVTVDELLDGEVAGIKSCTLSISGEYAFGYLKGESGVHRLVRISPFDSNKKRHTSFASVFVNPLVDDGIEIEIKSEDLKVDTFRASGAGGQHVNKTDSAIRITHMPTGTVVSCQAERSQHQNRDKAMKMLKSQLYMLEQERLAEEKAVREGVKKKIEWGSQIRSYVLHPYDMVKDHRHNHESRNSSAVLDGELDDFIKANLIYFRDGE